MTNINHNLMTWCRNQGHDGTTKIILKYRGVAIIVY